MAKAQSLNGKDLMLWVDGKVIALSTSCTLNLTASTQSSGTKDDGLWDANEVGNLSWNCSNESVDTAETNRTNDQVFDDLFTYYSAGQPIPVTVGIPSNQNTTGVPEAGWLAPASGTYSGQAIITSLSRTGAKGSNGSVSVSLQGYGAMVKVQGA